jgi:hypothetical protein
MQRKHQKFLEKYVLGESGFAVDKYRLCSFIKQA